MTSFTPFKAGHLGAIVPQPAQRREYAALVAGGAGALLEQYPSLTVWAGARAVAAGGCIPVTDHRAVSWAILSAAAGPHLLSIARKVRRVAKTLTYKRVEILVSADFEPGHRFARLIGGVLETPSPMMYYGFEGAHEMMYALYKKGT